MGVEDFVETEVAVAVAATAAALSPRARETMRKGLVYGVAGVLKAGDLVASAGRGVARGVQDATDRSGDGTPDAATPGDVAKPAVPKSPARKPARTAATPAGPTGI
jgi:hypothetical protein